MDFTVTYEPTPDEVARALAQVLKRQLRLTSLVLPSVLAVSGLVCLAVGSTGPGVGMLAGAVVFPLLLTWSIRRSARRQLAHLCVPTVIRMTTDGYECRTEQSSTSMKWSLFGKIVTGPEFWLFYAKKQCMGFLPRRAFDSGQQAEFDAFISSRHHAEAP